MYTDIKIYTYIYRVYNQADKLRYNSSANKIHIDGFLFPVPT